MTVVTGGPLSWSGSGDGGTRGGSSMSCAAGRWALRNAGPGRQGSSGQRVGRAPRWSVGDLHILSSDAAAGAAAAAKATSRPQRAERRPWIARRQRMLARVEESGDTGPGRHQPAAQLKQGGRPA